MLYPTKAQTRHIAGFTVVILLVVTAGYVVTHTDADRLSMAGHRTQDVVLLGNATPAKLGYAAQTQHGIGMGATGGVPSAATIADTQFAGASISTFAADAVSDRVAFSGGSQDFSGSLRADTRSNSAGSHGFAGGFSMAGHGAWGGVSGHAPNGRGADKAAKPPKAPKAGKAKGNGGSGNGSSGGSVAGTSGVAGFAASGTFTGSALGGDTVLALAGSPASSPSPTPEPMSLLLLGAGLGAVYQARRYLQ